MLKEQVTKRALSFLEKYNLDKIGVNFFIGGSCLNLREDKINDIDIFPKGENWNFDTLTKIFGEPKNKSSNAITFECNDTLLQFCNYPKNTLKELVESFDFSHVQIGCEITPNKSVEEVYYTQPYIESQAIGQTTFIGTEYPISSLIRLAKYYKKGYISNSQYRNMFLKIFTEVCLRGFKGKDDLIDQLQAIDLGESINNKTETIILDKLINKT